ncbi:MAG: polysaccharide deacetylase family protein [Chloroflexi bacterium]|nr:polysaccharide deacetylase family protein [Chloroflexota bacterium]
MLKIEQPLSIADRRSILFSARMRYASELQPVREVAVDKIVEQNILLAEKPEGLSLKELQQIGADSHISHFPIFNEYELQRSLERLTKGGSVNKSLKKAVKFKKQKFSLSKTSQSRLSTIQAQSSLLLTKVTDKIFSNYTDNPTEYKIPFIELISMLFADISRQYVLILQGEIDVDKLIKDDHIKTYAGKVCAKTTTIDRSILERGALRFFTEIDNDFNNIKWNLCQNYYVAQCLGADPRGRLLSNEIFGDAEFYLDTNVLINTLDPRAGFHQSTAAFLCACRNLGIKINICHITFEELARVCEHYINLLSKVSAQIPDSMASKISNIFYHIYLEEKTRTPDIQPEHCFEKFLNAKEELAKVVEFNVVDDKWFVNSSQDQKINTVVKMVKEETIKRRRSPKTHLSAVHDALLLEWISQQRHAEKATIWLVTMDRSLTIFESDVSETKQQPLAVTLDATIQWIGPAAISVGSQTDFPTVFAKAIQQQLLPQESFFDIREFIVFSEMDWATKELPAEDVEDCIKYIRRVAPGLNTSESADREKLAHEVNKFFVDPGRKFKAEIEQLLGSSVADFAYPKGAYNSRVRDLVARAGYERAVTAVCKSVGNGVDPLLVPRVGIFRYMRRARFKVALSWAGDAYAQLRGLGRDVIGEG